MVLVSTSLDTDSPPALNHTRGRTSPAPWMSKVMTRDCRVPALDDATGFQRVRALRGGSRGHDPTDGVADGCDGRPSLDYLWPEDAEPTWWSSMVDARSSQARLARHTA